MKFSEAMMLGMSSARLAAGQLAGNGAVCALGAGYRSFGWIDEHGEFINPGETLYGYQGEIVRWLTAEAAIAPCGCVDSDCLLRAHNTRGIIAHVFNKHVMGDKTWTPEKLVDYVRTIEPAEENILPDISLAEQEQLEDPDDDEEGDEDGGIFGTGDPYEMEHNQHGRGCR